MLHSINLLPWRDEQKLAHKKRFFYLLVVGVVVALSIQWGASGYLHQQMEQQRQRNTFLNQHIAAFNTQIRSLKKAEQQHQDLISRLQVVESLQVKRNKTTQFMDLLPRLIPEGVYVDSMRMNGQRVEISGIGDSTARLATMLDLFENTTSFSEVEMHSIVAGNVRFSKSFQSFKVSFVINEPTSVTTNQNKEK